MLLLQKRCFLSRLFLLVLNQGVQLAAHQGASLRQLFNFALQRIAPRLINAGNQRLIFGDGRMLRGTAERTRGTGLQASTLGLKTGNARFHFAQGFHIAQLLILLFISLTALSQYRFQFFLLLPGGLPGGVELHQALAQRLKLTM